MCFIYYVSLNMIAREKWLSFELPLGLQGYCYVIDCFCWWLTILDEPLHTEHSIMHANLLWACRMSHTISLLQKTPRAELWPLFCLFHIWFVPHNVDILVLVQSFSFSKPKEAHLTLKAFYHCGFHDRWLFQGAKRKPVSQLACMQHDGG